MKSTVQKGLGLQLKEELKMETINTLEKAILISRTAGASTMAINAAKKALRRYEAGELTEVEVERAIVMLENGAYPGMEIANYKELEPMLKLFKAKDSIRVVSVTLKRTKSGKAVGEVVTTTQSVGRAMRHVVLEDEAIIRVGKKSSRVITRNDYAPFTKDLIAVKFANENDLKVAQDKGFYVVHNGRETTAYVWSGSVLENVENGKRLSLEELKAQVLDMNCDLRLYKAFVFSPSDVRNISYVCADVTEEDNREIMLDAMSNGAWTKSKETVANMVAAGEDPKKIELWILKIMPRFGQFKAGSTNLGVIPTWAELNGNFKTYEGETVDGTCYVLDTYFARLLSKFSGMKISAKAVRGMFLQIRPDTDKDGAYVVSKKVMARYLKVYEGQYETRGDKSGFPVMLIDQNCKKADSNYRTTDIFFELLEIATCSQANTSMQMIMKPLMVNRKATAQFIDEVMTDDINRSVVNDFLTEEASIPTPGMVSKMYVSDLVSCIDPKRKLQDPALHKSAMNNFINSKVNAANKLKYAIDGNNVRLTSDTSQILAGTLDHTYSVVKYGEVYMPAAYSYFLKKAKTEVLAEVEGQDLPKEEIKALIVERFNKMDKLVCMIKYPSMGIKEYYLARVIGYADIKARVEAMDLEEDATEAILSFYGACKDTVAILPASKLVMFQCAGLDYDFDGATFVYDERFINLIKDQQIEATMIDN